MKKKLIQGLCCIAILCATPIYAKQASKESVKQMMVLTGAGEIGIQAMKQMLPMLKMQIPDAPESFWNEVMNEFSADSLIELIIPVYQKYLTEEEIKAINSFYLTPAARKLVNVQPNIMKESAKLGEKWGREIFLKVMNKYKSDFKK